MPCCLIQIFARMPSAIKISRSGDNLVLTIASTGEKLTITSYFSSDASTPSVVEEIRFADGTVWDVAAVKSRTIFGTSAGETLTGYASKGKARCRHWLPPCRPL